MLEDVKVEKGIIAAETKVVNKAIAKAILSKVDPIDYVTHEQFKQLTKKAKVIIRTGETTPYANIILQSGVIF